MTYLIWNWIGRLNSNSILRFSFFPGGIEGLMKYLKKNIKYPKPDKRSGKEGLTMVSFVVNRDGLVQDAKVI
ncbi:MAG TPA: energy transducer TonB, partial [Cryomorphaceae bacterium]|nr:energy transducer TonB [Cryomorphaceae bacterium]